MRVHREFRGLRAERKCGAANGPPRAGRTVFLSILRRIASVNGQTVCWHRAEAAAKAASKVVPQKGISVLAPQGGVRAFLFAGRFSYDQNRKTMAALTR